MRPYVKLWLDSQRVAGPMWAAGIFDSINSGRLFSGRINHILHDFCSKKFVS